MGSVAGSHRAAYEPAFAPYSLPGHPGHDERGGPDVPGDVARAQAQLDAFAALLADRGIVVRRPAAVDHGRGFATPDFEVPNGRNAACPRDVLLVVGDTIIEAPMAQRSRFFDYRPYRPLIAEYFEAGANWLACPKPLMGKALYSGASGPGQATTHGSFLADVEPCFDAACFARCGRDIFWQPDLVSNRSGADWVARALGQQFRIHRIEFDHPKAQHIDTTLVPVRPGIVLVNPERPCTNGALDRFVAANWRTIQAPPSVRAAHPSPSREVSNWISLNILMLDPWTVVVEAAEAPMIALMRALGCEVIAVEFDAVYPFGGSFHCCTLDVRRRGTLRDYFLRDHAAE